MLTAGAAVGSPAVGMIGLSSPTMATARTDDDPWAPLDPHSTADTKAGQSFKRLTSYKARGSVGVAQCEGGNARWWQVPVGLALDDEETVGQAKSKAKAKAKAKKAIPKAKPALAPCPLATFLVQQRNTPAHFCSTGRNLTHAPSPQASVRGARRPPKATLPLRWRRTLTTSLRRKIAAGQTQRARTGPWPVGRRRIAQQRWVGGQAVRCNEG